MPAAVAFTVTLSLVMGIFLGGMFLSDQSDATATWWRTGHSRVTMALTGSVVSVEEGAFTLLRESDAEQIRIFYDEQTLFLARLERITAGLIDSIRIVVVPSEIMLRPGTTVRVVGRMKENLAAPYALTVIGLPL